MTTNQSSTPVSGAYQGVMTRSRTRAALAAARNANNVPSSASVPVPDSSSVPVPVSSPASVPVSSSVPSAASVSSSAAKVSSLSSVTSMAKGKVSGSISSSTIIARCALAETARKKQVPGIPAHFKGAITRSRSALLDSAAGKIKAASPRSTSSSSPATSNGKDKAKASTSVSTVVARPALDEAPRRSQVPGIPAHVQGAITRSRMARLKYAARKIATPPSRPASSSSRDKGKGKATTEVSSATAQSSNAASANPAGPSASTALQSQLHRSSVASSSQNTLDMEIPHPSSSSLIPNEKDAEDVDEKDAEDVDEEDPSLASDAQPDFISLAIRSEADARFLASIGTGAQRPQVQYLIGTAARSQYPADGFIASQGISTFVDNWYNTLNDLLGVGVSSDSFPSSTSLLDNLLTDYARGRAQMKKASEAGLGSRFKTTRTSELSSYGYQESNETAIGCLPRTTSSRLTASTSRWMSTAKHATTTLTSSVPPAPTDTSTFST
ncbi:hypothetical protein CF327_g109 [Tilletia walkeri]|nr:hypothetical protein CF327_g109 [Tilletia walkeri]